MNLKKNIALLIDFDGILKIGDKPADDAKDFLQFVVDNEIPAHIISNSTLRTSKDLIEFLNKFNLDLGINAMTAVDATLNYVKDNYKNISVYARKDIEEVFKDFVIDDDPEAVVIGDLGERWNYENLNNIFRDVYNGADIIAMQKNRFWKPDGKTLTMDAGAFIKAVEYASSKEAILIGKPSALYFQTAVKNLGFDKEDEFYMVGDDIETDILAAQEINGKGILVFTGKTKYPLDKNYKTKPSYTAKNLSEVINLFKN